MAQHIGTALARQIRTPELVFASPQMRQLVSHLPATGDLPVLITGESGVGKEVIAGLLHGSGSRATGRLVALNCAALPEALAESELFGHVRGAFTGAGRDYDGVFVKASGGTLFLDEIGELSPALQAKLLRVLETMLVRPVGGLTERAIDVRLVSATNQDLDAMCQRGEFRSDLLYRIDVHSLDIPPLRERPEDLAALVPSLLARHAGDARVGATGMKALLQHSWPGNIRELRNVLVRAAASAQGTLIGVEHVHAAIFRRRWQRAPLALRANAYDFATDMLARNNGNRKATYDQLGVSKSTFYRWLRRGSVQDTRPQPRVRQVLEHGR